ncbi:siderophore ABC transporter substrate-binding protein [Pseudomonas cremoricolorata]|uniref:Ferric anguibactin-binding protein n=1 Tax=Pseudomonas cremoricolorata TaxID=157783 RepID=A0A089WQL7_9PSED|nr:siderophore ABC transporter substrate-binding protein [Pseudomonas cremoricolorata]AIR90871.1 ferric anguibactin-binding protein [Pseudomonas cremoricolorata]
MKPIHAMRPWSLTLLSAVLSLSGCFDGEPASRATAPPAQAPVTVEHGLGRTEVPRPVLRTVALDMNEVDFLDQLQVPIAAMPKDFVPDYLARYRDAADTLDAGAIVQPNLERVHAARPDLILITSLQANHYRALSEIAPTVQYDVDYRDSHSGYTEVIRQHLTTLGQIYDKQALAAEKIAALDADLARARAVTTGRSERALVVLHNNGAFTTFGVKSRYGFVFSELGVQPASAELDTGLHGQPISSEFIQQANPDILYVVDRTAVMEGRPRLNAETLSNPLLRQTNAWRQGRVRFVDPQAWYVTAASPTALSRIVDDVIEGYQD